MEGSFLYFINTTFDSTDVEHFKHSFYNKMHLLPENPCSYKIIYETLIDETTESQLALLNRVWLTYYKLKVNSRWGLQTNKKIELNSFVNR